MILAQLLEIYDCVALVFDLSVFGAIDRDGCLLAHLPKVSHLDADEALLHHIQKREYFAVVSLIEIKDRSKVEDLLLVVEAVEISGARVPALSFHFGPFARFLNLVAVFIGKNEQQNDHFPLVDASLSGRGFLRFAIVPKKGQSHIKDEACQLI